MRLTWAKKYGTCDTNKWKAIVFTVQSYSSTRKVRIRRISNKKYNNTLTQPVMRHRPKIHVCGCFTSQGVELLKRIHGNMNSGKYQKEILHDMRIVDKCLVFPESAFIFQHDLEPPQGAKGIVAFLKNKNVNVLPWPGNSSDLNPIENLWSVLERQLTPMKYTSTEELLRAFQDAWYKVPSNICRDLVSSMTKRLSKYSPNHDGTATLNSFRQDK